MALAFDFGGNALAEVVDNRYAAHFGILDFDGSGTTGQVGVLADVGVELLQRASDGRLVNAGRTSVVEVLVEAGIELAAGVDGPVRAGDTVDPHRTPTWMTLFEVVVFAGVFWRGALNRLAAQVMSARAASGFATMWVFWEFSTSAPVARISRPSSISGLSTGTPLE